MTGDAEIFVKAGAPVGRAAIISMSPAEVAQLKLQSFFVSADPAPPALTPADDLVDDAAQRSLNDTLLFRQHPLVAAESGPLAVHFLSSFEIWNGRPDFSYGAFANANVRLMLDDGTQLAETETDAVGKIDLKSTDLVRPLNKSDVIYFEYQTNVPNKEFGGRQFTEDIQSERHRARVYVDANGENTHTYRAKYEIHPHYTAFVDELAENEDDEPFDNDRGNMRQYEGKDARKYLPGIERTKQRIFEARRSLTEIDFLQEIGDFEYYYKTNDTQKTALTVLFEGDSWMNYPVDGNDIHSHLDEMFRHELKPGIIYNDLPFQHFGDRTDQMFTAPAGAASPRQWDFTADALKEYDIDVIICSAGGNDFGEPGISNRLPQNHSAVVAPYVRCFQGGHFDPSQISGRLTTPEEDVARRLMKQSFAALLKNHPWNFFLNPTGQLDGPGAVTAKLAPLLAALNSDFGESDVTKQDKVLDDIGKKVIKNLTSRANLPGEVGDAYDQLLTAVFDATRYKERFDTVMANWKRLLVTTTSLSIPVITHTYCYPLFSEKPTTVAGIPQAGPWFTPRFLEANILDRRIHKICLRNLIDNYVSYILTPLQNTYQGLFYFADGTDVNQDVDSWNDEIHLHSDGFKTVAERIFQKVKDHFKDRQPPLFKP
jgi:hypothetical protein